MALDKTTPANTDMTFCAGKRDEETVGPVLRMDCEDPTFGNGIKVEKKFPPEKTPGPDLLPLDLEEVEIRAKGAYFVNCKVFGNVFNIDVGF